MDSKKKINTGTSLRKARHVFAVLIILTVIFIWGHSLVDREHSAAESGWVRALVTPFLEIFVGKGNVTDHLVRKIAHFCEFALLGAEILWFFSAASPDTVLKPFRRSLLSLAHVMFVSTADETIQIFSGRGSQLQDVWLDNAGGAAGILFALCVPVFLSKVFKAPDTCPGKNQVLRSD